MHVLFLRPILPVCVALALAAGAGPGLAQDTPPAPAAPPPGRSVLPDALQPREEDSADNNCMTVCAEWGEDCTLVNRGIGGTTRQCRRVCRRFAEECFE